MAIPTYDKEPKGKTIVTVDEGKNGDYSCELTCKYTEDGTMYVVDYNVYKEDNEEK